jgi:hypothetical protein
MRVIVRWVKHRLFSHKLSKTQFLRDTLRKNDSRSTLWHEESAMRLQQDFVADARKSDIAQFATN